MKTIADVLNECEVMDKVTNGTFTWTVNQRYFEDGKLVVIATPHKDNHDSFELWNCGTEEYAHMPGLKKIQ